MRNGGNPTTSLTPAAAPGRVCADSKTDPALSTNDTEYADPPMTLRHPLTRRITRQGIVAIGRACRETKNQIGPLAAELGYSFSQIWRAVNGDVSPGRRMKIEAERSKRPNDRAARVSGDHPRHRRTEVD